MDKETQDTETRVASDERRSRQQGRPPFEGPSPDAGCGDRPMTGPATRGLVSIVLATYNEKETIATTIRNILEQVREPLEIIVVDDDSPDGTAEEVSALGFSDVKLIRRQGTRGLASAFMRGIIESRGEIIGWMDADMGMPPSLLPLMIQKLENHDVAIGSRYAAGGSDERPIIRKAASLAVNRFAGLVLGYGIRDYDSGFIVLKRSVFDKVSIIPTGYGEYFIEFIYNCCRKGLRVCEIPYTFRDRTAGRSKSFRSFWQFIRLGTSYVARILRAKFKKPE